MFRKLPPNWAISRFRCFKLYHLKDEDILRQVRNGEYESDSVRIVASWHEDGAIGFDIGANIGLFLLSVLSHYSFTNGHIFAFEPNPLTFCRLQCTIEANSLANRVTVMPLALSDRHGLSQFHVHIRRSCSGDGLLETGRAESAGVILVPSATLDEVMQSLKLPRLDWVKMDIEGAELWVLQGGCQTLRDHRPRILFEAHPENLAPYGISLGSIYEYLDGQEYRVLSCDGEPLTLESFRSSVSLGSNRNFIAQPAERL